MIGELRFYARETTWRESIGLLLWRPFVCRMRGHFWAYHDHWEDIEPPVMTERWRQCNRCERYEDLM